MDARLEQGQVLLNTLKIYVTLQSVFYSHEYIFKKFIAIKNLRWKLVENKKPSYKQISNLMQLAVSNYFKLWFLAEQNEE